MLMSIKQPSFMYIEETKCIGTWLSQHNSGNGSSMTTSLCLRSFAVIVYICGFDGNNILRRSIERQWQECMHRLRRIGIIDAKQISRSASDIVERKNALSDAILPVKLKLILLFNEY